jgi:class 3 adenylate cyclase
MVKTIGDAVMAVFTDPGQALRAALAMRDSIAAFNREHGSGDLALKIGLHRGACIAVTLNENNDYFGQTVNVAARVQGHADAGEICFTQEILEGANVPELLGPTAIACEEVQLKGVSKPVRVYRTSGPHRRAA